LVLVLLVIAEGRAGAAGVTLSTRATHEVVHVPPSAEPVRGPRFAPVTVDVYFAFAHSTSSVAAELARRAVERATAHDVRARFHLGAPAGFGTPPAELGYEAVIEAQAQERLWPLFDRLVRDRALGFLPAELTRAARDAGLDGNAFEQALLERRHRPAAERLLREGRALAHAAGELFINGKRVSVWSNDESLGAHIEAARRHAESLLADGVPLSHLYERLVAEANEPAPVESAPAPPPPDQRRLRVELDGAPQRGPSLAPVTLVVFSNFRCPPCAELAQVIKQIHRDHPGLVREVWKSFAASEADPGAAIAYAAAEQGRFWELYDRAMLPEAMQQYHGDLGPIAHGLGLDPQRLRPSSACRSAVERDLREARALGISYLPAVLVNGVLLVSPIPAARLERAVRAELARGLRDRLGGP
jgi:protein-disulfide isomerase